ncbi:methylmalonyl-CoA mutase family protein [Rossellomorea sp. AcN35-11]|nr:methylmalonyl-CoA mutase family protein [Rossellomorea aquimaris]WJV28101.1 methylmalonyl-CoA mutase family protein [Rossellomorea sp. AcN35-11]
MKLTDMKDQSFTPLTLADWQDAAEKALKGREIHTLHTKTYENIELKPLYTKEDLPVVDRVGAYIPNAEGKLEPGPKWFIAQMIRRTSWEELTSAVKEALSRGQNCLSFSARRLDFTNGFETFMKHFIGMDMPVFSLEKEAVYSLQRLMGIPEMSGIKGVIGFDPLSEIREDGLEDWLGLVEEADQHLPSLKTILINTAPYHNKGASATQELAYALCEGVAYIEALQQKGWTVEKIAGKMHFHFAVGSQFFMEMAKIRAFKRLWQQILSSYGLSEQVRAKSVSCSVETSRLNKSALDPYVNMLRSGGEAFSAILAGIDYLIVDPFDDVHGEVNPLSERIARNTQLILGEEAHLDKVVDPGGGSFYVEWLSEEVGKLAWKEFQQVEAEGGMIVCLKNGSIEEKIERVKDCRIQDLARRKNSMIGTNIYSNLEETFKAAAPTKHERLSLPFERLRERASRLAGKPTAGLIGLGELKSHKPRADFVKGVLSTGGIHALQSKECFSKEDVLQFVEETRFPYYVVCGADGEYLDKLSMILESILQIDSASVVDIAGSIPEKNRADWARMGLNGSIYSKQNLLEKLDELLTIWEEGKDSEEA